MDLIAHCGASYVERPKLTEPVLPPSTDTFQPIGHDYFIDLIEDRLNSANLRVVNEAFALSQDGANMFGVLEVGTNSDADFATVIGARNSHGKEFSAGLVCGSGVFVCDNMAFSGSVMVARKHTPLILQELPVLIDQAVASVVDLSKTQEARYEAYKARQLAAFEAEYLVVEMMRRGAINVQRVAKVIEQWDAPDHEEFSKTGQSAWRLFNAGTEASKGLSLNELAPRTQKMHALFDEVVEFDVAA